MDKIKRLNLRLDEKLFDAFDTEIKKNCTSKSKILRRLIYLYANSEYIRKVVHELDIDYDECD